MNTKILFLLIFSLLFARDSKGAVGSILVQPQNNFTCGSFTSFTLNLEGLVNWQLPANCSGYKETHTSTKWLVNNVQKATDLTNFVFNPTMQEITASNGIFIITAIATITTETLQQPATSGGPCVKTNMTGTIQSQATVQYKSINTNAIITGPNIVLKKGCTSTINLVINNPGINVIIPFINFNWSVPAGWQIIQNQPKNSVTLLTTNDPSANSTISCNYSYGSCSKSISFSIQGQAQVFQGTSSVINEIICPNSVYTFNVNALECGAPNYIWSAPGWTNLSYSNGNRTLTATSPSNLLPLNLNVSCNAFIPNYYGTPYIKNFQLFKRTNVSIYPSGTSINTSTQAKKYITINASPAANTKNQVSIFKKISPSSTNWEAVTSPFIATNLNVFRVMVLTNLDGLDCQGNDISFCQDFQLQGATVSNPGQVNPYASCSLAKVNDIQAENEYNASIYPSPTNGRFTFSATNTHNTIINIYNIVGQLVYTESLLDGITNYTINLENQGDGVYILKHINNKGLVLSTQKVILQK